MKILITGGAGFIGGALARKLVAGGHAVTIYDNLSSQVHGMRASPPRDLSNTCQFIIGDVRDVRNFHRALQGQEIVVHLAAETGTGQSMYKMSSYDSVNNHGVAVLLDFVVNNKSSNIQKLLVASSRAIYGEGKYRCDEHDTVFPGARIAYDLLRGAFEPRCPICDGSVSMLATDESALIHPSSYYGLTKYNQEASVLLFASQLGIPAYALRYQNVYGPGQSLINPYTGILAIFSGLARNDDQINVFEDGLSTRDFVHIEDIVSATCACIDDDKTDAVAMNVGSGSATSILDVARSVVGYFDSISKIEITGDFRLGDIRHNVADLSFAAYRIGYTPRHSFSEGVKTFLDWAAAGQRVQKCSFAASISELENARILRRGSK